LEVPREACCLEVLDDIFGKGEELTLVVLDQDLLKIWGKWVSYNPDDANKCGKCKLTDVKASTLTSGVILLFRFMSPRNAWRSAF
jgi:hypothetical protein